MDGCQSFRSLLVSVTSVSPTQHLHSKQWLIYQFSGKAGLVRDLLWHHPQMCFPDTFLCTLSRKALKACKFPYTSSKLKLSSATNNRIISKDLWLFRDSTLPYSATEFFKILPSPHLTWNFKWGNDKRESRHCRKQLSTSRRLCGLPARSERWGVVIEDLGWVSKHRLPDSSQFAQYYFYI